MSVNIISYLTFLIVFPLGLYSPYVCCVPTSRVVLKFPAVFSGGVVYREGEVRAEPRVHGSWLCLFPAPRLICKIQAMGAASQA